MKRHEGGLNERTPLTKTPQDALQGGGGGAGGGVAGSSDDDYFVRIHSDADDEAAAEEEGGMTATLTWALLVAALSQFLVGYNTGVMNAPVDVVFPDHSTLSWAVAVAAFAAGGPFGADLAGKMADTRGRRGAMIIDEWIFVVGGLMQALAPNMSVIIVARFVIGFASGYSSVVVPIYLNEMSPPHLRGSLGTITQFALVIGIFAADLLAFPFATEGMWRILFGFTPLVAVIQLILSSTLLLESPRWQLMHKKTDLARQSITKLRSSRSQDLLNHEVERFLSSATLDELGITLESGHHHRRKSSSSLSLLSLSMTPASASEDDDDDDEEPTHSEILAEMWEHGSLRLLLISAVVLNVTQQLSGINAVFYYSTGFFQGVIDNPLVGTTYAGGVNVLATWAALIIMDKVGRKTLILWSCGGMFICCVMVVLSLLRYFNNTVALVSVLAYVVFFEIGLGPIPWLIVSEMFIGKEVAVAQKISVQANWACNFFIGLVFPYMDLYLGPYSFGPFAVILLLCFIYVYALLPETQGRTEHEVAVELERMLGNRNIQLGQRSFVSTHRDAAATATKATAP